MIRGWCPSLHEPMLTGDGLLVRVKPPLGQVSAAAARALAAAALAHGNGTIELTGRGALQFRGLTVESAARFAGLVVGLRLAHADPAVERRRSILVSPLAGCDPGVAPATVELAHALETAIVADHGLAALPAKFRFAVDGGGALPLGDGAEVTLRVGLEGCSIAAALQAAHASLLPLPPGEGRGEGGPGCTTLTQPSPGGRGLFDAIGSLAGGRAFGAGVRFGSMDAATLAALADVAERGGDGVIRLTPWRAVVIAGLADPARLAALGLIVSPDDPALRVSACPGRPGCASASVVTREIAARLRPAPGVDVHVSGCSKGCAHPGPAALTFVGRDGRFDLVRAGRAGDAPVRRGIAAIDVR